MGIKSMKSKVILMSLVITLLAATSLTFYGTMRTQSIVRTSNLEYMNTLSKELALQVENFLERQMGYLEGHAQALTSTGDYSHEFLAHFTKIMAEGNPNALYIYFNTLTDAGHFTSSDGWIPPDDYSWEERYWIEPVSKTDAIFVGPPHPDTVTGSVVTLLRRRVVDGEVQGVLNIAINLDQLTQVVEAFELPAGAEAFLIDEEGGIVAYKDRRLFHDVDDAPTIDAVIEGFDLEADTFLLNQNRYISAPVANANWRVWIAVPESFFSKGLLETFAGFMMIFFLVGVASVALAYVLGNHFTNPILKLKAFAERISSGDYMVNISPDLLELNDEIGDFAMTFSEMKDRIRQRKMELQGLYEEMAAAEETLRENYDELEKYKDQVEHYAFHNPKTGIYNRDYFINLLKSIGSPNLLKDKIVLYISFSELTHYVETLGHTLNESLHQKIAETLQKHLEVYHLGTLFDLSIGRFVLLSASAYKDALTLFVHQVKKDIQIIQPIENVNLRITLLVGGYEVEEEILNTPDFMEQFLEFAETAMAKNGDFHPINWFNQTMYQDRKFVTQIETDLHFAVERNQFHVVYQPQFDDQGTIVGAEALIRWNHPEYGNISPVQFIPIAENAGLVDIVGHYIMNEVLALQKKLALTLEETIPISVNVSFLELINPNYAEEVNTLLAQYDVPASALVIEVTETAFSKHLDMAKETMVKLGERGYSIHLDDFGTEYSSLVYLTRFPVHGIKIDKVFIDDFLVDDKVKNVIRTVIELAHLIGIQVIAEGVETREQFEGLKTLHCDYFQGYVFSKPLREEAFLKRLGDGG